MTVKAKYIEKGIHFGISIDLNVNANLSTETVSLGSYFTENKDDNALLTFVRIKKDSAGERR